VVAFFLRPRSGGRFRSGADKTCSAALPTKADDPRGRRFLRCQFAHNPKTCAVSTGLPHLRLNRRVIRYDLGELMGVAPEARSFFFDIAALLSSTNAIGFSEIVGITCTWRSKNSDRFSSALVTNRQTIWRTQDEDNTYWSPAHVAFAFWPA
jgi:hypothetical protein